jgi:hypothetical protein
VTFMHLTVCVVFRFSSDLVERPGSVKEPSTPGEVARTRAATAFTANGSAIGLLVFLHV